MKIIFVQMSNKSPNHISNQTRNKVKLNILKRFTQNAIIWRLLSKALTSYEHVEALSSSCVFLQHSNSSSIHHTSTTTFRGFLKDLWILLSIILMEIFPLILRGRCIQVVPFSSLSDVLVSYKGNEPPMEYEWHL